MSNISALSSAILGIQRGQQGLRENAAKIASAETFNSNNPVSIVEPMIGLKQNELLIKASAEVVKTVDRTIGSILDIRV